MSSHEVVGTAHAHGSHAPPWLFAITSIPYGVVGAFASVTMPFLTRKAGIDMEEIGWFGFATMIPSMFQFLYAPMIDFGPKRRVWLIIVSFLGAMCLGGAMMMSLPAHKNAFLGLTVAGQLIAGLVGSCNGGMISASMPDALRGKTAGWLNTGNLTGGAFGSAIALWMNGRFEPKYIAVALVAMMVIPSLAALAIPEAHRKAQAPREVFVGLLHDVWSVVKTRAGWTGILLCASPVGTAALGNYFSALAVDYHASEQRVILVNGWLSGIVTAIGALGGGFVCDRMNRRKAYLLSGALTAAVALMMRAAPQNETTYLVGVVTYQLVTGFCYAAFSAFIFEVVGDVVGKAAATQYTLFTAAGNFAIAYVGKIDTHYQVAFGVRGVLAADAIQNVIGIVVLVIVFALVLQTPKRLPASAAT